MESMIFFGNTHVSVISNATMLEFALVNWLFINNKD